MSLKLKYSFFDYSIIRWVNDPSHFQDTFNPQNNQYFGHTVRSNNIRGYESGYVHPLLINDGRYDGIHRLPIVEYDIDKKMPYPSDLMIFYVNDHQSIQLPGVVENDANNIYYITFLANQITTPGRLEILGLSESISNELLMNSDFDNPGGDISPWVFEFGNVVEIGTGFVTSSESRIRSFININQGVKYRITLKFDVLTSIPGTPAFVSAGFGIGIGDQFLNSSFAVGSVNELEFDYISNMTTDRIYFQALNFGKNIRLNEFSLKKYTEEKVPYKYSECVRFVSEIPYITLHTRNYFNKNGLNWQYNPANNWLRTNLPAKCLGMTNVVPERELQRLGGKNSYEAIESRNDQEITYEYLTDGKSRLLDSIEVLAGNTGSDAGFYLDLIRLTPTGEIEREDEVFGKATYYVQVNDDYSVVEVDDDAIFDDVRPLITNLTPLDGSVFTENIDNTFTLNVTYNRPIQLTTDLSKEFRIYKDNILYLKLFPNDLVIVSNSVLLYPIITTYDVGEYRIEIDDDFVLENTFGLFGANGIPSSIHTEWTFKVEEFRYFEDQFEDQFE